MGHAPFTLARTPGPLVGATAGPVPSRRSPRAGWPSTGSWPPTAARCCGGSRHRL